MDLVGSPVLSLLRLSGVYSFLPFLALTYSLSPLYSSFLLFHACLSRVLNTFFCHGAKS